jgi:leucyl-tRNA synthetase
VTSSDIPAGAGPEATFRYTAELAAGIEARWQDRWENEGTFHAPNPVGDLAEPGRG